MLKNKTLIFAFLIAILIIGGAVMLAKKQPNIPDEAGEEITFDSDRLVLTEALQVCSPQDRCIVVDTHCGFCCQFVAINAKFEHVFNTSFDRSCRRYTGQPCGCFDLSSYPKCVEGKCQLIPWPDSSSFSQPRSSPKPAELSAPITSGPDLVDTMQPEPVPQTTAPEPYTEPYSEPEPAPYYQEPTPDNTPSTPDATDDVFYDTHPATEMQSTQPETQDTWEETPVNEGDLYAPLPDTLPSDMQQQQEQQYKWDDPLNRPLPSGNPQ